MRPLFLHSIKLLWHSLIIPTFENIDFKLYSNNTLLSVGIVRVKVEYLVKAGAVMALLLLLASSVKAQDVVIPDANFKSALVANTEINTNEDTEIQVSEALAFDGTIDVTDSDIADLTGIEAFVNLARLTCDQNKLTSLDLSSNLALRDLSCSSNRLVELDVSQNTALVELDCSHNRLLSLDVSENQNLEELFCEENQLTDLILGTDSALETLTCFDNKLSTLDVSGTLGLVTLNCGYNDLTSLDVSANQALEQLRCSGNRLSILDLTACPTLFGLWCSGNELTTLDLSANTNLYYFEASENELTALDLESNLKLEGFMAESNKLTTINLGSNTYIYFVMVNNNLLTSLDLSTNTFLEELECSSNQLTSLDLSANGDLEFVDCSKNQLTHLDLRSGNNGALRWLNAEDNLLTCIVVDDVSPIPSSWSKDDQTTYCSDVPTAVDLTTERNTTNQSTIPITITFGEVVSGFELSDIDVSNGTVANLQSSDQITYTATLTPLEEGMVSLNLDGHQVENERGEPNASAPELTIEYDLTAPSSLLITSATTDTPILVTVFFSEEVKGFELADLRLENCTASALDKTNGETYSLELMPLKTGQVLVELPADQLTDLAGNGNLAAPQFSFEFEVVLGWSEEAQDRIRLYPNPAKDQIRIQSGDQLLASKEIQITLTNVDGKQVLKEKARLDAVGSISINLAPYPPGLYVIQLSEQNTQFRKKILKR